MESIFSARRAVVVLAATTRYRRRRFAETVWPRKEEEKEIIEERFLLPFFSPYHRATGCTAFERKRYKTTVFVLFFILKFRFFSRSFVKQLVVIREQIETVTVECIHG